MIDTEDEHYGEILYNLETGETERILYGKILYVLLNPSKFRKPTKKEKAEYKLKELDQSRGMS